jgi:hypothetical protein
MILGDCDIAPAAGIQISVRAHAEICAVYVLVGLFARESISTLVQRFDIDPQVKGVQPNDAGHGFGVGIGMPQMCIDPVQGHMGVCIGVRQPQSLRVRIAEVAQSRRRAESSGGAW